MWLLTSNQIITPSRIFARLGLTLFLGKKNLMCLVTRTPSSSNPFYLNLVGLCTIYYKFLAKALVNQLKPLLPFFITPLQVVFMRGKQTYDLFIMAQQIMNSMKNSKSKVG